MGYRSPRNRHSCTEDNYHTIIPSVTTERYGRQVAMTGPSAGRVARRKLDTTAKPVAV